MTFGPGRPYRVSEGPGIGTQYVRLITLESWSLCRSDMLSASQMPQPTMNDSTRKASRLMNLAYPVFTHTPKM
jgi:hypothetical protein